MRLFRGRNAQVFVVSEPAAFRSSLACCDGVGFDWRVPDRSLGLWLERDLQVYVDGWPSEPETVEAWAGRVSLPRAVSDSAVAVEGECLPLSLLASCASWGLQTTLDAIGGKVLFEDTGVLEAGGRVFCVLPLGAGAIRGFGTIVEGSASPARVKVEGELRYGSRV